MKLIGCDRCGAVFPRETRHTALWVFDVTEDEMDHDAPEPSCTKELCPVCRSDLNAFLDGVGDVAGIHAPAAKPLEAVPAEPHACNSLGGRFGVTSAPPQRSCEICGRVGTQRFVQTETGWRCSPTAVKCPGNKATSDIPAKQFPSDVTPSAEREPKPPAPTPAPGRPSEPEPPPLEFPPGVTARCRDCPRRWNLTGIVLRHAIDLHEFKHSHIVDVLEGATA